MQSTVYFEKEVKQSKIQNVRHINVNKHSAQTKQLHSHQNVCFQYEIKGLVINEINF